MGSFLWSAFCQSLLIKTSYKKALCLAHLLQSAFTGARRSKRFNRNALTQALYAKLCNSSSVTQAIESRLLSPTQAVTDKGLSVQRKHQKSLHRSPASLWGEDAPEGQRGLQGNLDRREQVSRWSVQGLPGLHRASVKILLRCFSK